MEIEFDTIERNDINFLDIIITEDESETQLVYMVGEHITLDKKYGLFCFTNGTFYPVCSQKIGDKGNNLEVGIKALIHTWDEKIVKIVPRKQTILKIK